MHGPVTHYQPSRGQKEVNGKEWGKRPASRHGEEGPVTTQMRSNANAIYQYLEKFDRKRKEKSQSVRQDLNPLYSVP